MSDKITVVKSLADLALPGEGAVDVPRVGGKVLRVPIKAITLEEQEKWAEKYKPPRPPVQPRPNPETHKMEFIPNDTDPAYLDALQKHNNFNARLILITGLGFEVDGKDVDEKYENLAKQLTVGDLAIILGAILEISNVDDEIISTAKNSLSRR